MQAPCDWNQETVGTSNVAVCIIDSGIQTDHPDLKSNIWINTAEIPNNGIDDDGNGELHFPNGLTKLDLPLAASHCDTAWLYCKERLEGTSPILAAERDPLLSTAEPVNDVRACCNMSLG